MNGVYLRLLCGFLRNYIMADDTKPWMRYAGMVETGNAQSSQGIDDFVYGHKD
jgi:hypothetical protein